MQIDSLRSQLIGFIKSISGDFPDVEKKLNSFIEQQLTNSGMDILTNYFRTCGENLDRMAPGNRLMDIVTRVLVKT